MDKGTYTSASAGLLQLRQLDVVNHNLANVNTPGYKRQFLIRRQREFEETLAGQMNVIDPYAKGDYDRSPEALHVATATDFSQGPIQNTGNPLDVALTKPNQFFVVNGSEGPLYTRAGNFTLNEEGQLVTQDGFPVQGDGGEIIVNGGSASISANGSVLVDGQQVGRLAVVRFEDTDGLERTEGTRFKLLPGQPGGQAVDDPSLAPQALEMSNVSTIGSVVDLISANRGFEMYSKAARSIDEMNSTAITRLGRRS